MRAKHIHSAEEIQNSELHVVHEWRIEKVALPRETVSLHFESVKPVYGVQTLRWHLLLKLDHPDYLAYFGDGIEGYRLVSLGFHYLDLY